MGGRLQRGGQDCTGRWRRECSELEDRLGYSPGEIFKTWSQVALIREFGSVGDVPREACEELAFCNVIEMFDKQACGHEVAN